jgi:hypothetical protein
MAGEHRSWRRQDEEFWRAHHEAWKRSDLNQRQYCEAEGIPLKAFGNWRAQFKAEPQRRPRANDKRPSHEPARRAPAVELDPFESRRLTARVRSGRLRRKRNPRPFSLDLADLGHVGRDALSSHRRVCLSTGSSWLLAM